MRDQNVLYYLYEARMVSWLQDYLELEDMELSSLLSNEKIHELKVADLNDLFDSMVTEEDEFTLDFFSLQPNVDEPRIYYVELLTNGGVMKKRIAVPVVGQRSFVETSMIVIQQFFESLLVEMTNVHDSEEQSQEEVHAASTQQEEELVDMKFSDNLVFKDPFEAEKAPEATSEIIESSEKWDFEEAELEEANYSVSLDILEILGDEDDFEFEELDDDFEFEELEDEVLIDFTVLNDEIVNLYRAANAETRQTLKQVKAEFWELELKQEDDEISASDIQALIQTVLAIDVDEQEVLKWQVNTMRLLIQEVK